MLISDNLNWFISYLQSYEISQIITQYNTLTCAFKVFFNLTVCRRTSWNKTLELFTSLITKRFTHYLTCFPDLNWFSSNFIFWKVSWAATKIITFARCIYTVFTNVFHRNGMQDKFSHLQLVLEWLFVKCCWSLFVSQKVILVLNNVHWKALRVLHKTVLQEAGQDRTEIHPQSTQSTSACEWS